MNKLIFILLIILPTLVYSQQNYYVSNTGSNQNNGLTKGTAWQTISKLNSTTFSPGDSILFERGGHWREQFTLRQSGTEANRITISAYGEGDKPIIDAAEISTGWHNEGGNIWSITNPLPTGYPGQGFLLVVINNILIREVAKIGDLEENTFFNDPSSTPRKIFVHSIVNPDMLNTQISNRYYGISAWQQNYVTVSHIEVRHAGNNGLWLGAENKENGHIHVHDVTASRNRIAGIRISGKIWHNLIENCIVSENGNGVLAWGNEGDGETEGPEYTTIRNCKSYNSVEMRQVNGPAADGTGFQLFMANKSVIENCESYDDFIPIMLDADYHNGYYTARYNKMYASDALDKSMFGIGLRSLGEGASFDIYYNLVVNYGDNHYETTGIFWGWHEGAVARILVANNTVYTDDTRATMGAILFRRCDNLIMKNNILVFPSSTDNYKNVVSFGYGDLESDYNMFQKIHSSGWNVSFGQWPNNSRYSDLATWRTASGQDLNSIEGDPSFADVGNYDFTLKSGSPAIGAGVKIPDIPQFDIEGNPLPDRPSMGAFEFVSKTSPPSSTKRTLTINIVGDGSVEIDGSTGTQSITVDSDTNVTLRAIPDAGWTFSNWTLDASGSGNPMEVKMDEDKTITAVFKQDSYSLTVTSQGQGSVSKNPDQTEYLSGEEVEIVATPQPGWEFLSWAGDASGSVNSPEVLMDEDKNITAQFAQISHSLTVTSNGEGSITISPDQHSYSKGTMVDIEATPLPGWEFLNWAGDATGHSNPIEVTMDASKNIVAVFTEATYNLTIISEGEGSVDINPDQLSFTLGTPIFLQAITKEGWQFDEWSGDLNSIYSSESFIIEKDMEITAKFSNIPKSDNPLTGVSENGIIPDAEENILIYPNPACDYFRISIKESILESSYFQIINLNGKIVYEDSINSDIIDVRIPDKIKKGIYIIKIILGGLPYYTQKMVICSSLIKSTNHHTVPVAPWFTHLLKIKSLRLHSPLLCG